MIPPGINKILASGFVVGFCLKIYTYIYDLDVSENVVIYPSKLLFARQK